MSGIVTLFIAFSTLAAPLKVVTDFYKESESAYYSAQKETNHDKKAKHLLDLHKSLEATMAQYQKANPNEGTDAEQDVSRLFYTLEPAFDLAKMKKTTEETCEQKKQWALRDDRAGRDEESAPTAQGKEVLRWIELLCK